MYKIAIVEDEDKSASRLYEIIKRCCDELDVKCQIERFKNGMEFMTDYKPVFDLILLDIEMPLLDGMETAKKLRDLDKEVFLMFITNFAQYAIKGYEVEALDFVVKPVEFNSFLIKFKKFLKMVTERKDKYIVLTTDGSVRRINVRNILFIEIVGHFLYYHLYDEIIAEYGAINQAESDMQQYGFCRIYKSYLVNLACIRSINVNTVIMDDGTELLISRFKKKEFMKKAADYFGNGYLTGGGGNT